MDYIAGTKTRKVGNFKTPDFVKRYPGNPILTGKMMPYNSHLVFNASVVEYDGKYIMMFRNEWYPEEGVPKGNVANLSIAESEDGINWTPWPDFVDFKDDRLTGYIYDPRVLPLDGKYYITLCMESNYGPRAVTMITENFKKFTFHDIAPPCSRNFVLFPEKINGLYWRLERPFWQSVDSYLHKANTWISRPYNIWICSSPDLKHWGDYKPLLECNMFDYANIKIGPGGFPIKTEEGWLLLLHGVDWDPSRGKNGWQKNWRNRYHGGVALLDLENPEKVIAYNPLPFITPEADYEHLNGWRNDVIFPMSGITQDNGDLYIYYGAADTHTCLATCKTQELVDFCLDGVRP